MSGKPFLAEAVGTFALVFIGAGSVVVNGLTNGGLGLVGIALAHGLVLMAMIYATGHISGGHINPAVTVSMWFTRKLPTKKAVGYVVSQLIGAGIAGVLLSLVFSGFPAGTLGTPGLASGISLEQGILIEAVLTFFLVFVIFGVAVDKRAPQNIYGLAIGLVLTFDILMGGFMTGAAMNPARAFGPALASGYWATQPVYWIGPIIGGIIAAVVYNYGLLEKEKKK